MYCSSFVEDVITCYNYVWDTYETIPYIEDVWETYIDSQKSRIVEFIAGKYTQFGQYGDAERVLLCDGFSEHDLVLFGLEADFSSQSFDDLKVTIRFLLEDIGIAHVDDETRLCHNLAQANLW